MSPASIAPRRWARPRARNAAGARSSHRAVPSSYGLIPMLEAAPISVMGRDIAINLLPSGRSTVQRLRQIRDQISWILEAHVQAQQAIAVAPRVGRLVEVGRHRQARDAAPAVAHAKEPQAVHGGVD